MKSLFLKFTAIILTSSLMVSCVDDDFSEPTLECVDNTVTPTKTVQDMYALASSTITQYTADDYLEAYVVSSDRGGNFFKTISLQTLDGSRAFSVAVDASNTYTKGYYPGRKVYVKLKDLYYNITQSSLLIGAEYTNPSTGAVSVGRISPYEYTNTIIQSCSDVDEEELVQKFTISQAKNNLHINKLIELDRVEFEEAAVGSAYYDPNNTLGGATNHLITDIDGNTIIFRTSSFATYAGDIIPNKSGKIRGVLTKFNSDFQFIARSADDIKLTEPRLSEEDEEPIEPVEDGILLFPGGNFEDYPAFLASLNNFGIKPYATQSATTGILGSTSLKIATSAATGNDYVFTTRPYSGLPATYNKIKFYVKGTSAKSISLNVYKQNGEFYVFNLSDVTGSKTVSVAPNNQYTGTINTGGEWSLITLDLAGITDLNTTNLTADFFALKIGSGVNYDLHLDGFTIE